LNKAPRKRRALASDGNDFSVVQLRALLMRLSLGRTLELPKEARERKNYRHLLHWPRNRRDCTPTELPGKFHLLIRMIRIFTARNGLE
jgi:hypothetical protein